MKSIGIEQVGPWLKGWWEQNRVLPKIALIMENRSGEPVGAASYVAWPRLMICLEGSRAYRSGSDKRNRYRMVAGQALYFAPGTWISPLPVTGFRSLGVHWEPGRVRLILREGNSRDAPRAVWTVPWPTGSERSLTRKIAEFGGRASGHYAGEGLLLAETGRLIDRLEAGVEPGAGRRQYLYLRLCAFLEEHFAEPHSRESVASRFGISPGHLTRIFREEGGVGFNAFLGDLRLQEARRLLESWSLPVQEAALQCGFTDPAYFARLFRKRFGTPPSRGRLKRG